MSDYPMMIVPLDEEDGGGFAAFFPDLPGCVADGGTPVEAAENGVDALDCWLEVQAERSALVPEPLSHALEQEEKMEAMEHAIARLTTDLERAKQRIRELEASPAHRNWTVSETSVGHRRGIRKTGGFMSFFAAHLPDEKAC